MKCFLRYDDGKFIPYRSKKEAAEAFLTVAVEIARYGQDIVAALHYEETEYPEWVLSLTPRLKVKWERA